MIRSVMSRSPNVLSIDLEDWFHAELVRHEVPEAERQPRLRESLEPLLALVRSRGMKATFFILGTIIQDEPDLVRELHREGHEIGCHGMTHVPLWYLTPDAFRTELRTWRAVVRDLDPSIRVRGYRAPTFSLDWKTAWALEILAEEGFEYDSSIFPYRNHLYGVRKAPLEPYRPDPSDLTKHSSSGPILEFPLTVLSMAGVRVPIAGGVYARALPYAVQVWALRRIIRDRPFVLYAHPWELDANTPRRRLGLLNNLITYTGIKSAMHKFERLFDEFEFTRMDEVLKSFE